MNPFRKIDRWCLFESEKVLHPQHPLVETFELVPQLQLSKWGQTELRFTAVTAVDKYNGVFAS